MIWHVIYEDQKGRILSRAARSRDAAIHMACELMQQSHVVRRAIGPDGSMIERAEAEIRIHAGAPLPCSRGRGRAAAAS